jgi:hypothetical protein
VIKQQGGGNLGLHEHLISSLAAVEEAEGMSHLVISDDKLALYLAEIDLEGLEGVFCANTHG